jgi:beta-glucanase (GH16 family)
MDIAVESSISATASLSVLTSRSAYPDTVSDVSSGYTNQATQPENADTTASGPAPNNCTSELHEYRVDWTEKYTAFYLDGVLQKKFMTDVPSQPGRWMWNNWANGNKRELE